MDRGIRKEHTLVELPLPENTKWFRSRIFWMLAVATCVAAAVTISSLPRVKRSYHRWSERRAVERAREFYAKREFKHALLDARTALDLNFRNVAAIRIIVESLEAMGAPEAIEWRKRLAAISPGDAENVLALAKAALKAGDIATAERTLAGLKPEDRNSAPYHAVAATLALWKRDMENAEIHWAMASKLDPKEASHRFNLAAVQMRSPSPGVRADALEFLKDMSARPGTRLATLQAMLGDALAHGDRERAKDLANEMASDPGATFSTKLRRLTTLRAIQDPDATALLPQLKEEALSKPGDLYQLLAWMNWQNLSWLVLEWLPGLPADAATRPPVCVAIVEAYARSLDWEKLRETIEPASWGELDFLRGAYLARALDHLDDPAGASQAWKAALAAAEKSGETLERLAIMSLGWRWPQRAEEALWKLSTHDRCPRWALDFLWGEARKRGDAAQLFAISRQFVKADPRSIVARNDFICLSLLTRNTERDTHDLAAALYTEAPGNAYVASTYGLSLFQQGRVQEAVAVMRTLKPEQLRAPGIALYHGIFLIAAKQADEAKEYIEIGTKRPLLPAEKTMLDRVTAAYQSEAVPSQEAAAAPK